MRKKLRTCFMGILLLSAMLAGCNNGGADATGVPPVVSVTTAPTDVLQPTDTEPVQTEPLFGPGYVVVRTAYGDLCYQDQWHGYMLTEQKTEGDTVVVSFSAKIGENKYSLFEVTIGGIEGISSGQLTGSDGIRRNVYVHMDAIVESSELTDGELTRLYAMQEDINYIIDNLE